MSGGIFLTGRREMLAITAGAALLPAGLAQRASAAVANRKQPATGRDIAFDDGWLFLRGAAEGLEDPALRDAAWRKVDLPHDWSIEDSPGGQAPRQLGPFNRDSKGSNATGFTEGGEGWYRKHFRVDGFPAASRIEIAFDGAYLETDVWLNGHHLGSTVNGYTPFAYDLTPYLDRAGDNVLAVHVRNLGRNSRWYSGSGLYRQVTLDVLPAQSRIARWGVGAWTSALEGGAARIEVGTRLETPVEGVELVTRLLDAQGATVAQAVSPAATAEVQQQLAVRAPRLWSPDKPYLYQLETIVRRGEEILDHMVQDFGIRIVTFDPDRGMSINGQPTKLWGGCIHHDNGLLGACAYRDADERRIRLLKERGFNAIRSAHNPSSRSLREACDRQGMLLIEEAFDAWHEHKEPQDFSLHFKEHWEEVIRAMVLPARNSPSVILWSIGNEIPYRATDEGVEWEWKLANAVKRLDPTRPVTAGLNGVLGGEMIAPEQTARPGRGGKVDNASTIFLDVPGYNYRDEDIEPEHAVHPERVVYASETFPRDMVFYKRLADRAPYFLGEFVWTAMDYFGEAGIGANAQLKKGAPPFFIPGWPWVNSWCGDIDLIGKQKASSLARDVVWGISPVEMAVQRPVADGKFEYVSNWGWSDELQSWTWPEAEGRPINVRVYTGADAVELRLNGKRVDRKTVTADDKMRAEFSLPYEKGVLEAFAYANGKLVGKRRLETVGPAAALRLFPEQRGGQTGRQALAYIQVEIVDAQGRVLPDDMRPVQLSIDGPADLVAFGSAAPFAMGSLQSRNAQSYRGRLLAILRGQEKGGTVRVAVQSAGIRSARFDLKLE